MKREEESIIPRLLWDNQTLTLKKVPMVEQTHNLLPTIRDLVQM